MTKTHVIDGVTYVEAPERCFVYGDYVIVKHPDYKEHIVKYHPETAVPDGCHIILLEPVKPKLSELLVKCTPENRHEEVFVDERQASPQVIDMLANLARRVTSLESQLRDTQNNLEKQAKEIAEANYVLNSPSLWATHEDVIELNGKIVELDARTNEFTTTSKSGAKLLAEAFDALARYERTVGR